jgi:spore maturation protein CgeB
MRADGLPHTPAIRVLEALACGLPVVTAPWDECDQMFTPGVDVLVGRNGREIERYLADLHGDAEFARFVGANGYQTVVSRHTCGHRAQELMAICHDLGLDTARKADLENTARSLAQVRRPAQERSRTPAAWS